VTVFSGGGFGFTEYQIKVNDLSVHLPQGDYFLNVTPTGDLTGRSFDSTTSGVNCVGTPCGNNQNAFFDSNFFGFFFTSTGNPALGQPYDFSMGVNGSVTNEMGGITLTTSLRRHKGARLVLLSWTPSDGGRITVLRDGVFRDETNDDGRTQDRVNSGETHTYQVCETDTGTCSNITTIHIP
jgi:hypothetical protein